MKTTLTRFISKGESWYWHLLDFMAQYNPIIIVREFQLHVLGYHFFVVQKKNKFSQKELSTFLQN